MTHVPYAAAAFLLDGAFKKMNLPDGAEGMVAKWECGDSMQEVAIYSDGSKMWIRKTSQSDVSGNNSTISELATVDYSRLLEPLCKEVFMSLNAIFDENTLDGEHYLVKYILGNRESRVFLGNPDTCGNTDAINLAQNLKQLLSLA